MSDDRPDPPYPPDVDLSDFPFTPIYRARLFGSSFHARATDAEWRAGVTLWLKSQDQVPAGTLPNDDIDLCRLAELGRDMRTWKKIRQGALHRWYECSDGRLYHPVVTEVVKEQHTGKLKRKWSSDCGRVKKHCQRHGIKFEAPTFEQWLSVGQTINVPGTAEECPRDALEMSQGQGSDVPRENGSNREGEGQGQGQGDSYSEDPDGSSAPPSGAPPPRDPVKEIFDLADTLGPRGRALAGKARKQFGDIAVLEALIACRDEGPSEPVPFFLKCLEARNHRGNSKQSPIAKLYEGAWLAGEEWDRGQGNRGDCDPPDVPLLDRRRPH